MLPGGKNAKECYEFSSHVTKATFNINRYFEYNSNSLSCKVYGKQYEGFTTERLTFQCNNYKSYQRKAERGETFMQKYLHKHFLSEDHNDFINNVEIILSIKLAHRILQKNMGELSLRP